MHIYIYIYTIIILHRNVKQYSRKMQRQCRPYIRPATWCWRWRTHNCNNPMKWTQTLRRQKKEKKKKNDQQNHRKKIDVHVDGIGGGRLETWMAIQKKANGLIIRRSINVKVTEKRRIAVVESDGGKVKGRCFGSDAQEESQEEEREWEWKSRSWSRKRTKMERKIHYYYYYYCY